MKIHVYLEYHVDLEIHPTNHISVRIQSQDKEDEKFMFLLPNFLTESIMDRVLLDAGLKIKERLNKLI